MVFEVMSKLVYFILLLVLFGCNRNESINPSPVNLPDQEEKPPFSRGSGSVIFKEYKPLANKPVTLYYYNPNDDASELAIVFVCHGASRNGSDYRNTWITMANKYNLLIVAPEFSDKYYPGSDQYNLGNLYRSGVAVDERYWTYSIIEPIFDYVVETIGGNQTGYDIFGHSAGAQFVHRLMTFKKDIRANLVVPANAGWYTMPDSTISFPYGIKDSPANKDDLERIFQKNFLIILGDADTLRTSNLRQTPEADAQGLNRFERGNNYYKMAKRTAELMNTPFVWQLDTVPAVGHSSSGMFTYIVDEIYGNN